MNLLQVNPGKYQIIAIDPKLFIKELEDYVDFNIPRITKKHSGEHSLLFFEPLLRVDFNIPRITKTHSGEHSLLFFEPLL
ncbi:hypothetical protein pdam_00017473, partial [Pocillopora damicornis]